MLVATPQNSLMAIERGTMVEARTASGRWVKLVALGDPAQGKDFPVLWVCTPDEWGQATSRGEEPEGIPWPMDAVRVLETA